MESRFTLHPFGPLQGYLAHKKQRPPKTLQQEYAQGPTVVLRERKFLMSELPLYRDRETLRDLAVTKVMPLHSPLASENGST